MSTLSGLRDRYGDVFVSRFEDVDVPWKPLNVGEFVRYQADLEAGIISPHVVQEEIFRRCVTAEKLSKDLQLRAGVVPTVATQVLQFSGPGGIDEFNQELELARLIVRNHPIHEGVILICRAFPGYTPDQVYGLSYGEFMLRLAQAEALLVESGVLKQPLKMTAAGASAAEEPQKPKILPRGLKEAWEASRQPAPTTPSPRPLAAPQEAERPPRAKSPVIEAMNRGEYYLGKGNKLWAEEIGAVESGASGWDKADRPMARAKMVQDAREIYKDLIGELQKGQGRNSGTP